MSARYQTLNAGGNGVLSFEKAIRTPYILEKKYHLNSSCGPVANRTASVAPKDNQLALLDISRINLSEYAQRLEVARSLFEYLFYALNEPQLALKLIGLVSGKGNPICKRQACNITEDNKKRKTPGPDWWWLLQKAQCFTRLGMLRDAETAAKDSVAQQPSTDAYMLLGALAIHNNQPMGAIQSYTCGLSKLPEDVDILFSLACRKEEMGETDSALLLYKQVANLDSTHTGALNAVAAHYYHEGQPEVALNVYRRMLLLGFESAELYNNLGLCAFYAQQYETCINYFNQAIQMSTSKSAAEIFYNVAHIGIRLGDLNLSYQCLRISLAYDSRHAEAYNNLGVVEQYRGRMDMAKVFYETSCDLDEELFEPRHNMALLHDQMSEFYAAYNYAVQALSLLPNNENLLQLQSKLSVYFRTT
ncbi:Tetratricopeptide repeat protein 8, variant 2 [Clonorchis sinensis]|nr:Tetratricopeptide repeat protein 8, variant 2 [Clonorchis sinensis]